MPARHDEIQVQSPLPSQPTDLEIRKRVALVEQPALLVPRTRELAPAPDMAVGEAKAALKKADVRSVVT